MVKYQRKQQSTQIRNGTYIYYSIPATCFGQLKYLPAVLRAFSVNTVERAPQI